LPASNGKKIVKLEEKQIGKLDSVKNEKRMFNNGMEFPIKRLIKRMKFLHFTNEYFPVIIPNASR
jgi:hypothetical protein